MRQHNRGIDANDAENRRKCRGDAHNDSKKEQFDHQIGRDHNRQCAFRGETNHGDSDQSCKAKSNEGVEQRLRDNDFVDIAVGGAYRAQRSELEKMLFGVGIKCLRDDPVPTITLSSAPANNAAPAPVPESQNDRL